MATFLGKWPGEQVRLIDCEKRTVGLPESDIVNQCLLKNKV